MAENDNSPLNGEGNGNNLRVDIVTLIHEIKILFETVVAALDSLKVQGAAKPLAEQLSVIQKLASQSGEALETLHNAVQTLFKTA